MTSADWVEILEPRSQERMYVNLTTGECGWEPPIGVPVRQADGNQWWELFDPHSNRFYYYNSADRMTVWHRPQGADIVPLSQLQAMKRNTEHRTDRSTKERRHGNQSTGSQDRRTPLPPMEPYSQELECATKEPTEQEIDSRQKSDLQSMDGNRENLREEQRDMSQRWQPPPGSKAAMLVKVSSIGRSQGRGISGAASLHLPQSKANGHSACTLNSGSIKSVSGYMLSQQAYKTTPGGKIAPDTRQAHHLRKASNGSFCLVTSGDSSPTSPQPQSSSPRPVSPHYGATARFYDDPLADCPIYDEPPMDMEVEGAHLHNGTSRHNHSLQKVKLLQHPGQSYIGSRHKRNPSDYSPAGLECIKHMVNVDPKQGLLSASPMPSPIPSPTSAPESLLLPTRGLQKEPVSLEKKQSLRIVEAGLLRAMEVHHSRQGSQGSQDYSTPPPPAVSYQDSGYSTGPSPSLRRKSRRRMGAGGRPGSVGSAGELTALNERLMEEMREVVSRSNTMRETKASLDSEMSEGCSTQRTHSTGQCSSREDISSSSRSLSRTGNYPNVAFTQLDIPGRQKRTYEKVDTLEMNIALSSPETAGPPSQAATLEPKVQLDNRTKSKVDNRMGSLGPHRHVVSDTNLQRSDAGGYQLSYATLRQPPPPDATMADWASKHLNMHTQGLFRRRVSIANMLSWNRGSIKKPMLMTNDRTVRKEACEMFKLVQAYMGDRPSRLDRRHAALLIVTKCWGMQGLRDELYVQLVRQTTGNNSPRSLAAGWELMAVCLAFFAPSPKFCCYLEGYIQRHMEQTNDKKITQFILDQQDIKKKNSKSRKKRKQNSEEEADALPISTYAKYCHRKLQKVAITGGKKGLRKPNIEEVDHSRRAIITPSLFGSSLEEVMERQSELFPDRKLPWVQVQLSQYVLALGGAQTEGIFRVPGDIDEVNALKLQVDQWRIPENLSDPNVPASLMKLWYRELEEPLIPMSFYKQCISNYDDPVAAISVVQSLPELNRLVLCYFIHFLQVFAQPTNVAVTKMDVNNLAMVMAPNCLRCQSDDPRVIFENTRKEMSFLRMLIVHLDTSFIEGIV